MSAYEWVDLGFRVLVVTVSLLFQVLILVLLWRFFQAVAQPWMHRRGSSFPSPRIFFRRIYCKHPVVARTRDPYGRNFTACARCGVDINQGRPREQWR